MAKINSIYLAQSIDKSDPENEELIFEIRKILSRGHAVIFDPGRAFRLNGDVMKSMDYEWGSEQSQYIVRVNAEAMLNADLRIFINKGNQSWGMPIELLKTTLERLPFVYLDFTGSDVLPVYLRWMLLSSGAVYCSNYVPEPFLREIVAELPSRFLEKMRVWATPMEMDDESEN